jgi:hypothetical protein
MRIVDGCCDNCCFITACIPIVAWEHAQGGYIKNKNNRSNFHETKLRKTFKTGRKNYPPIMV